MKKLNYYRMLLLFVSYSGKITDLSALLLHSLHRLPWPISLDIIAQKITILVSWSNSPWQWPVYNSHLPFPTIYHDPVQTNGYIPHTFSWHLNEKNDDWPKWLTYSKHLNGDETVILITLWWRHNSELWNWGTHKPEWHHKNKLVMITFNVYIMSYKIFSARVPFLQH